MAKSKLLTGDTVVVVAGKEKGKRGKVVRFAPQDRVVVEGVNQVSRHVKANQERSEGGVVVQDAPLHRSNVMLLDPEKDAPTRVGLKFVEPKGKDKKGKWVRFSKKSGFLFDQA